MALGNTCLAPETKGHPALHVSGLRNVTRKTKIGFAIALTLVVVVVILFFRGSSQDRVQVTFVGLGTNGSNSLVFALANRQNKSLRYHIDWEVMRNRAWLYYGDNRPAYNQPIAGHSTNLFHTIMVTTNRWRPFVPYVEVIEPSVWNRTRSKVSQFALDRGWTNVWRQTYPRGQRKKVYGPEMCGDRPVAPARESR